MSDSTSPRTYRILALDGGAGGYLTLKLLEKIESLRPGFLDSVDIFAGTSAGAINACFLATCASAEDAFAAMREQWRNMSKHTFRPVQLMLGLTGRFPILPNEPILDSLRNLLGDIELGDVPRKIIIPALRLDNRAPVRTERRWGIRIFSNLLPDTPESGDLLHDVVLRSASAPVMWPAYQGYSDGGLFANNPSLLAISHAIDHLDATQSQFQVLSIGTGQKYSYLDSKRGQLGFSQWLLDPATPMALLQAVMDTNSAAVSYTCSRLLQDKFFRLDPKLGESLLIKDLTLAAEAKFDAIVKAAPIAGVVDWLDYNGWTRPEAPPKPKPKKKAGASRAGKRSSTAKRTPKKQAR